MKLKDESSWDKRQIKAINNWYKDKNGVITAYTGFGKTRGLAFRAIQKLIEDGKAPKNILVCVPGFKLKQDWEELLETIKIPFQVVIVNTLIKNTYEADLYIIDEIHRNAANTFIESFKVVKYNNFLGLTASFERQDDRHLLLLQYTVIVDNIPLSEGLENGWVDPFTIIKIPITLTEKEQSKLDAINDEYQEVVTALPGKNPLKSASFFVSYLDLNKWVIGKKTKQVKFVKGLEKKFEANGIPKQDWGKWIDNYFIRPTTAHEYFQNALLAKKFYKLVNQRKSLLYNAEDKFKKTLILAEEYSSEYKFILSREIKFIKKVQESLPKGTSKMYHSKLSFKNNKNNFNIFNDGRTKVKTLLSVKALNEGVDIPKLSTLIITSYTASMLDKIQTFGRALRKYKDKKVTMIYLYTPGSQEEKWLNTILTGEKVKKLKL